MLKVFYFIFFIIILNSYSFAKDLTFVCKPVFASVQLDNGKYYSETIDDKNTPFINALPISYYFLDTNNLFYKNNDKRKFEQLIPFEAFSILEIDSKRNNPFSEIWKAFIEWDKLLKLDNFKTFIYPYKSYDENGNSKLSMKRISIHLENNKTAEITVPISEDRKSYFVEKSCEKEKVIDSILSSPDSNIKNLSKNNIVNSIFLG